MGDRANNFDALRLGAALSVLLTHAFLLGEGRLDRDPLMLATGGQCALGVAGLFVFFTISGYLVTASCEATGSTARFLAKRALRIYPGLAFCLVLLAFGLGPMVTRLALADYAADPSTYGYVAANLMMNADWHGLPGVRFSFWDAGSVVDGPLWSLPCEVLMYLMVAALGALRLLRLEAIGVLLAGGLVGVALDTAKSSLLVGSALWLLPYFAAGMALWKLRDRPIFGPWIALAALAGLALGAVLHVFLLLFPVCGGYLVIWLARAGRRVLPAAAWGDLSYGLYIYGWPVEQGVVRALGGAAPWWQVVALALPVTGALAFLSWHLVEAPALRFKPRRARPAAAVAAQ
jgi:peptidoglycan/LPS O-acetylase OafA/YrhL